MTGSEEILDTWHPITPVATLARPMKRMILLITRDIRRILLGISKFHIKLYPPFWLWWLAAEFKDMTVFIPNLN